MGGLGSISHGIKLVFLHFVLIYFFGWGFLKGSLGRNGVTAPGGGSELLGKEGGGVLSRFSHWLSRPLM